MLQEVVLYLCTKWAQVEVGGGERVKSGDGEELEGRKWGH